MQRQDCKAVSYQKEETADKECVVEGVVSDKREGGSAAERNFILFHPWRGRGRVQSCLGGQTGTPEHLKLAEWSLTDKQLPAPDMMDVQQLTAAFDPLTADTQGVRMALIISPSCSDLLEPAFSTRLLAVYHKAWWHTANTAQLNTITHKCLTLAKELDGIRFVLLIVQDLKLVKKTSFDFKFLKRKHVLCSKHCRFLAFSLLSNV